MGEGGGGGGGGRGWMMMMESLKVGDKNRMTSFVKDQRRQLPTILCLGNKNTAELQEIREQS